MRHRPAHSQKTRHKWPYIVIGLLIFFGSLFSFWQIQGSQFWRRSWRSYILLHTSPPVVVSLPHQAEEKMILVTLPEDVEINVPYGYGPYRLNAIWKLGELEKKPELPTAAIGDLLSIPLSLRIGENEPRILETRSKEEFAQSIKNVFSLTELLRTDISNLNLIDRLKFALTLKTGSDGMVVIFLHRSYDITSQVTLPSGVVVKQISEDNLNSQIGQQFEDEGIRSDGLIVAVKNTTDTPGLGQEFAQILSNIGAKVIAVGNEKSHESGCRVEVTSANKDRLLVKFLVKEYACQLAVGSPEGAEIVVYIGEAFSRRWGMP